MSVTISDVDAFAEFARQQATAGGADTTMADLAAKWQAMREREAVNEAIREGLDDVDAGRTQSFSDSQDAFRRARHLPPRT